MEFGVFGISHHTATVELREKFSLTTELQEQMFDYFKTHDQMHVVAVSTCNRFELYYLSTEGLAGIQDMIEELYEVQIADIEAYSYYMSGAEALRHLLKVVCGLDSLVLGETQILGQIKEAWIEAQSRGISHKILNGIFERAVRFGKKCHTEFALNHHAVSVSSVAVKLAKQALGELEGKSVLLIGAGEMARIAADHLATYGLDQFFIANRTVENAQILADKTGATAIALDDICPHLTQVDAVISSISTKDYFLKPEQMSGILPKRSGKKLVMIDIGVPRNLHPQIGELPDVELFDIDSITSKVEESERLRRQEADKILTMVEQELLEVNKWMHSELVTPLIKELTGQAEFIQQEIMKKIKNKIPHLEENMYNVVNHFSNQAIKKIINNPIKKLREISSQTDESSQVHDMMDYFADLFDLQKVIDPNLQKLIVDFHITEPKTNRRDARTAEVVK